MEASTREILLSLASALSSDSRNLALSKAEKALEESEEVRELSRKTKEAYEAYGYSADHFGLESEETKKKQHELYLAKKALDEHPLSQEYNARFALVRRLYAEVDAILIGPYREKRVCLERKQ